MTPDSQLTTHNSQLPTPLHSRITESGYEVRTVAGPESVCPTCGKAVRTMAESNAWGPRSASGVRPHFGYGLAQADCCGWWFWEHDGEVERAKPVIRPPSGN